MNMNNREAQNELCRSTSRSTKTPEEVYRIALSYNVDISMLNHVIRQPWEQEQAAPPLEPERSKLKRNRWGQSEGDTEIADSAAVDRSGDEQI